MRTVLWSGPLLIRALTWNEEEENYKRVVVTKIDNKMHSYTEAGY
ncbi:hypothetical protein [uncultured Methanospirillum sp.]|nr:hypothetical protein [uncultured Methanospirillum sp.]